MTTKKRYPFNYTLVNEDTSLEVMIANKVRPKRIISVAGSGARSLPLLSCNPIELLCTDPAREQVLLVELRKQTMEQFAYQEFLFFWGYPPFDEKKMGRRREKLFLQLDISNKCRNFFMDIFSDFEWESLLYAGKWENSYARLSKIVRLVLGKNYDDIFKFSELSEQKEYFAKEFSKKKLNLIIGILGNSAVFNRFIYKKKNLIKKNIPDSYFKYYRTAFEHLFTNTCARENFFLHLCFFGKIYHVDGLPIEAEKSNFLKVQKNLREKKTKISYRAVDLIKAIQGKKRDKVDFVSLSNHPSYYTGEQEKNFMQKIMPALAPGAVLVLRSYLRVPNMDLTGLEDITNNFAKEIKKEKVQVYKIQVFKKI